MVRSPRYRLSILLSGSAGLCVAAPTSLAQHSEPAKPVSRASSRTWPAEIAAPPGMKDAPGPWSDPNEATVWPNRASRANGDAWLAEHHDQIRRMEPRVLLVNFSNEHTREHLERLAAAIIAALAESSRYHGYSDPKAPALLNYRVFKLVDLRDPDRTQGNSRRIPVKDPKASKGFNMKYAAYFSDEFAALYGIPDPADSKRFLRLDELVDGGYIHELWFFESGNTQALPQSGAFEVVEEKPHYDEAFRRIGDSWVQAGNGGDDEQPWTGRSLRIGCVNASRGPGCFLESLAHGLEHTATSGAIPYFTRYFREFAGLDLDARYELPFDSFYAVDYGKAANQYPDPGTLVVRQSEKEYRIESYRAFGGNAHFPPNARRHYDLDNGSPVLSTIEDWRIGSGPGGADAAVPWTNAAFARYRDLAPDCMGPWLVYWRQNMPGLDNRQKDDARKPMKNWWPFLFY